jgi:N6-adenosine-specific RNA methylase IME4
MTEMIKYDAACRAIAEAKRVDDVKSIKDKAEALRAYARQAKNPQLEADAWEIRKRAEDKLGELSAALDTAKKVGKGKGSIRLPAGGKLKAQELKAAGISTSAANRYEQFNRLSDAEKERRIARGRAAIEAGKSIADAIIRQDDKKGRRAERERELGKKQLALPDECFGVIVADPEWDDTVWSRETGMDRHAANHYPTSDASVIASRPVASIAAKDCVLFLWTTNQHLRIAFGVLAAWGFEYKSNYMWGKESISTGRWNRSKHEILLIGTRGNVPCPAQGTQWDSLIMAPKGEHSAKPEIFLQMIEQYFPTMPKIELNRRGPARPGWSAWGLEAEQEGGRCRSGREPEAPPLNESAASW